MRQHLEEAQPRRPREPRRRAASGHGKRPGGTPIGILIVGDDGLGRRLLSATIAVGERRLLCASDGREAVLMARRERPAVVLIDGGVRGMDAAEVCRRIAGARSRRLAVVVLTADPDQDVRRAALAAGAAAVVHKPFSPSELQRLVDRLAEGDG